jgi:hypothetical protein
VLGDAPNPGKAAGGGATCPEPSFAKTENESAICSRKIKANADENLEKVRILKKCWQNPVITASRKKK